MKSESAAGIVGWLDRTKTTEQEENPRASMTKKTRVPVWLRSPKSAREVADGNRRGIVNGALRTHGNHPL